LLKWNIGIYTLRDLNEDGNRVRRQQERVIVDEEQYSPFASRTAAFLAAPISLPRR